MDSTAQSQLHPLNEDRFKEIAYNVVGHAFSIHSDFGTLLQENAYKHELAARCETDGMTVETEYPIELIHANYKKTFRIDLIVDSTPFELKVTNSINDSHRSQLLNYLFIANANRAKLLNFGASSLEHEFVSTSLTHQNRREIQWGLEDFTPVGDFCEPFIEKLKTLVSDWGMRLTLKTYYEAIIHLFGGEEEVITSIPLKIGNKTIHQKAHLISTDVAFKITNIEGSSEYLKRQIALWLKRTELAAVHWINFQKQTLRLITVKK